MTEKTPTLNLYIIVVFIIVMISSVYYFYSKLVPYFTAGFKPGLRNEIPFLTDMADYYFYGNRILENAGTFVTRCEDSPYCIIYSNSGDKWSGFINTVSPVELYDENFIRISLKNSEGRAGINLIGNLSEEAKNWWIDRIGLNLIASGSSLEINADTGTRQETMAVWTGKLPEDTDGYLSFYLKTDKTGSKLTLYDRNGNQLKNIKYAGFDLNGKFGGFFPAGKLYIGLTAEPRSILKIRIFNGIPVAENEN